MLKGKRSIDIFGLRSRVDTLFNNHFNSAYQKKKSKIQVDLEGFMCGLGKDIHMCSPSDICLFLAWCDGKGKTKIHNVKCPDIGDRKTSCGCPLRLAYSTVVTKVSQLKSVFSNMGRLKVWCHESYTGNPVCSREVDIYTKQIKVEQSKAHVMPGQAKPMFLPKLADIFFYIGRQLEGKVSSPASRFILARDQALFKLMFFGGDRAHDSGVMLSQELRELPGGSGFLIRHTWGKTHNVSNPKVFSILRSKDVNICPVRGIEVYLATARDMGIDLSTGYLFRPVFRDVVREQSLSYEAIYARLKYYLGILGLDEGETPHSFRGGCALSLQACVGNDDGVASLMQHIGWATEASARHYARSDRINQAEKAASFMASSGVLGKVGNSHFEEYDLGKVTLQ